MLRETPPHAVPAARTDDLITSVVSGEALVYDLRTHHLHRLTAFTATVWKLCDGHRSIADLIEMAQPQVPEAVVLQFVELALGRLESAGLLSDALPEAIRPSCHPPRRAALAGAMTVPAADPTAVMTQLARTCPGDCA